MRHAMWLKATPVVGLRKSCAEMHGSDWLPKLWLPELDHLEVGNLAGARTAR